MTDQQSAEAAAQSFRDTFESVRAEVARAMVGQEQVIRGVLTALFAGGHVLLEGVPGLGKTLLVRSLGEALDLSFSRIQFTPDMMPADVSGAQVLVDGDDGGTKLVFQPGPIVANLVLADEINRATPKTQSALLEAMQEKQVTAGGKTIQLESPFCVMATQNPVEQEGTYPLPEAQMDRFLFKILVGYPKESDYAEILGRTTGEEEAQLKPVSSGSDVVSLRQTVRSVPVPKAVQDYAVRLVMATQPGSDYAPNLVNQYVSLGASPRGAQALLLAGKVLALLGGRFAVSCDDVAAAAKDALRHRVQLSFAGQAEGITGDAVVAEVLKSIDKPHVPA